MFGAGALIKLLREFLNNSPRRDPDWLTAARELEAEVDAAFAEYFTVPGVSPFAGSRTHTPGADTTAAVQSRNGSGRFSLTPFHEAHDG